MKGCCFMVKRGKIIKVKNYLFQILLDTLIFYMYIYEYIRILAKLHTRFVEKI